MSSFSQSYTDLTFYAVVDLLKSRGVLPSDAFNSAVPFFSLCQDLREAQIRELFQSKEDIMDYEAAIQDLLVHLSANATLGAVEQSNSTELMTFAQIVLYKVLPCQDHNCRRCPREVVTHNQYKDAEYECPFYHHDKDRRRLVISAEIREEFEYKANYFDDRRPTGNRADYSQNYFESMFHPLYYKMFRCKRAQCNAHQFCPAFHNEKERLMWDNYFSSFMGKNRVSYVKDKQKYYENSSATLRRDSQKSNSPEDATLRISDQEAGNKAFYEPKSAEKWRNKKGSHYALKQWNGDNFEMFNSWGNTAVRVK